MRQASTGNPGVKESQKQHRRETQTPRVQTARMSAFAGHVRAIQGGLMRMVLAAVMFTVHEAAGEKALVWQN